MPYDRCIDARILCLIMYGEKGGLDTAFRFGVENCGQQPELDA